VPSSAAQSDHYTELGHFFADVLDRASHFQHGKEPAPAKDPVVITGAALGLPGTDHIFDDANLARILRGDQFIDLIPTRLRKAMLDKHITRLVKSDNGGPTFETISNVADVIKLAGRGGAFDLETEFGISADRRAALDRVTQLAIAVGLDALRDAGIPLVMRYKTTTKGTQLQDRWALPDALREDTGVIFASAFPGCDSFADEMSRYYGDHSRREQLGLLEGLLARGAKGNGDSALEQEIERRTEDLRDAIEKEPYVFDRRFLLRTLAMGHSQFAEFIGARGPNTQINSACASTTQAVSLAEDWIRAGRCRRVIVISADDVTSDHSIEWFGAGFLASGAAATDEVVEEAATPFDRRRHGLIVGMGAAGLVVESAEAARERGIQPICEVLSTVTANSAFHGTRLDVQHIGQMMENLVSQAESLHGISRQQIAPHTVFVSHETYTPARGGSASAEINALRRVFGAAADQIVIANTKGQTGHAMGTGIEDVLAVKALETGLVPPVANFKEVDPELGTLNLSKGGGYPIEYAVRLGAGFGSQISMSLLHWTPLKDGAHRRPNELGYAYRIADESTWESWLSKMAGYPTADLEVVRRTLRVRDQRPAARLAEVAQAQVAQKVHESPVPATTKAVAPVVVVAKVEPPRPVIAAKVETRPPAPVPPPPLKPAVEADPVKERVLALVAEKTGYPVDMLDLDLDLEADLGIDTVKQAEVMATIREAYGIVRDDTIKLRDFPTLARVIQFVYDRRPGLLAPQPTPAPAVVSTPEVKTVDVVKAAPPVAIAMPAPIPASISAKDEDAVKERILALMVEKTGYPQDMLDLDLDLEADLGVDTVKQAEMFAAIREIYNIPRDENRKLRDYPTLAHVIRFVYEKRPDLRATTPIPAPVASVTEEITVQAIPPAPAQASVQTGDAVKARILALMVEKTGYPQDMLDLDLDLEADLGVDTVKQAEMFAAIREIYSIPRDENRKLRDYPTLAHVIRFVYEKRPDLAGALTAAEPTSVASSPAQAGPVAPPPAPVEASANSNDSITKDDPIKRMVLQIVAEKTGYPEDMLDLDLDLEADLGVDTVKQAEMFAAVRAAYNIPRDENMKLRDFPTLAHVIKFAHDRSALVAATAVPAMKLHQTEPKVAPAPSARPTLANFDATDRIPRRVPVATLRPPLTVCKETGVKLDRSSRVIVMPDKGGVAPALTERLRALGVQVLAIEGPPDSETLNPLLKSWTAAGPIQGVFWLPALDKEDDLRKLDSAVWHDALRVRVKSLYTTMRTLYEHVAGTGTFFVSSTRLGGHHGYDDAGASAPLGGSVTGFTKTYKRERPESLVKAIDFESNRNPSEIVGLLIDETLRDPGAVEIGYTADQRWTVGLDEQPASDGQPGMVLDKNSVFVITGAAGSIVSAITADLAAASGGTFYLLDLVPKPDPANPDLKRFATDKENLKRDLFARIQNRGERATPALVEKELASLERAHAAQAAIDAVLAAGGTPHYFSVNLADEQAVAKVIDEVRKSHGRVDVLLHAAGIERSHFLPDKDPREFDLVFDVKADGFFNLLHAIGDMPLRATVAFSSIAGRFGNAGQTDYSSANDLLCKITSSFRTTRPNTRGIVIDWTAWGGIGMATRGSIPKMMELAGIDMLPPEAGIPLIRRELTAGATRGEVVVAQRLGVLLNELDATGGLDASAAQSTKKSSPAGPITGPIISLGVSNGYTVETILNPHDQPFLHDHQIEGTPVLPGVMGIEAFAEAALALLPGWQVEAIEDVNFLAPFKFYRSEPRALQIETRIHPSGEELLAECRLIGHRSLPNQAEPQPTTHFTARVRLTKQRAQAPLAHTLGRPEGHVIEAADIYRLYFHGPAYQVLEKAWWDGKRLIGLMASTLPPNHQPSERCTIVKPRLIELCFQTAGIWELGVQGRMGLPQHVHQVSLYRTTAATDGKLYAVLTPDATHGSFDVDVTDTKGNCVLRLTGYQTVALPNAVNAQSLKTLQEIMSGDAVLVA
jgi:3-oxoacyl-(acyl-carrier-protein) synthase/acyl carrier protein/NAD(P)-dependent dehydrogenase (short-subunit alcohol dehydrogenase family)